MKRVVYPKFGVPDKILEIREEPSLVPQAGEVVIRLEAAPIHLADLHHIAGLPYFDQYEPPGTPGYEGVGRILAVGPKVSGAHPGDRVFLPIRFGAWCEECVASADNLWTAPDHIPAEQLALVPINMTTAYLLLTTVATLKSGDWIIQNAGNSNVASYVIRFARRLGLHTINIVRRSSLLVRLEALGGDLNVVHTENLAECLRELGIGPVRLALDAIGGDWCARLAQCLAQDGGIVATYGLASGKPCQLPGELLIFRSVLVRGFYMTRALHDLGPDGAEETRNALNRFLGDEPPSATIAAVYPISEVRTAVAHAARTGSAREGKIILTL